MSLHALLAGRRELRRASRVAHGAGDASGADVGEVHLPAGRRVERGGGGGGGGGSGLGGAGLLDVVASAGSVGFMGGGQGDQRGRDVDVDALEHQLPNDVVQHEIGDPFGRAPLAAIVAARVTNSRSRGQGGGGEGRKWSEGQKKEGRWGTWERRNRALAAAPVDPGAVQLFGPRAQSCKPVASAKVQQFEQGRFGVRAEVEVGVIGVEVAEVLLVAEQEVEPGLQAGRAIVDHVLVPTRRKLPSNTRIVRVVGKPLPALVDGWITKVPEHRGDPPGKALAWVALVSVADERVLCDAAVRGHARGRERRKARGSRSSGDATEEGRDGLMVLY